jgi:orotidine-5'-phosphate decarboxylase
MHFADRLTDRIASTSPVCVGLDPQLGKFPAEISKDAEGMLAFCKGIIDAVKDTASCVKLQLAFYELLGWEGMKTFWEVCDYAKSKGLVVIADGKRNDIGSTCEAYADAYLSAGKPVDALTVTPFLGSDGITPFIDRCAKNEKGIFILVKTSNPSSGELQDLPIGDETLSEHLAQMVDGWGREHIGKTSELSFVGAVVGAPYPEDLKYLRTLMPQAPLLIPGYGAQGGTAADVLHGFLPGRKAAVVNASRSIIHASSGPDWREAAAGAVKTMANELA